MLCDSPESAAACPGLDVLKPTKEIPIINVAQFANPNNTTQNGAYSEKVTSPNTAITTDVAQTVIRVL
ncbi:hypothetical protein MACH09_30440 [Vibrio sp. MACH09]|nr:hypothetical protein MACH09_30440 [Vibrio sp. MACH09]